MNKALRFAVALATSASLLLGPWAVLPAAAATSARPQVVIAIGNSESMDGNLGGAIMTGSGSLNVLQSTTSPVNFSLTDPNNSGFITPAASTPAGASSAPYTVSSGGNLVDNSPSRLNVAKNGLKAMLSQYLASMDFALEDYSVSGPYVGPTWVYYMSTGSSFQFTNTLPTNAYTDYQSFIAADPSASPAPTRWVSNPCYGYSSAPTTVNQACQSIAGLYPSVSLGSQQYMQISASSDDPTVNDVLYWNGSGAPGPVFVSYNGPYPSSPYPPNYSLSDYENGNVVLTYKSTKPNLGFWLQTTPTNAGYVANTPQVMYSARGFGYGSNDVSATGGSTVVGMTTNLDGLTPGSAAYTTALNTDMSAFRSALAPETNNLNSSEIKAMAGQAATAGLVKASGALLPDSSSNCAGRYVILVTDGLPTKDLQGLNWPPLGSASGNSYGVYASFYGMPGNSQYGIKDDSSNTGGPSGTLDVANTNDKALVDTIAQIQSLASKGIATYVVGLGTGVDPKKNPAANYALQAMALAGKPPLSVMKNPPAGLGVVYSANSAQTFAAALQSIATSISGTVIASAPAVPGYVQSGSLAYLLASDNTSNKQGYFEAFSTDANGNVSSSPAWTLQMTAAQRQTDLLTDSGSGSGVQTLAGTSATAFGSPTSPTAATIINYTIDPSYNGGTYLAGRASGSFLGTITSQADKPVILSRPNNPNFIGTASYATFAKANASRTPLVLFTSDDGFLYAVTAGAVGSPGTLQWAWMPSVFLPQLQYYGQFQGKQMMNGGMRTVDSADASGNWATYVAGTAQSGALHYDLKLTGCSSSSSACTPAITKVWYDQQAGYTSPPQAAPQAPAIWWDNSNVAYAAYFTVSGSSSYLNVMRLYDGSTSKASLSFTPSSAVYVDTAAQRLYVGDTAGKIWSFDLSTGTTASKVTGPTLVGTAPNETGSGAIRYLGLAQTSSGLYLWATQDHQVQAFKFTGGAVTASTTGWTLWWWSGIGGSGYFVPTSSGGGSMVTLTTDPGVGSTTQPYWLEAGSTITDSSAVQAATLIVPDTVTPTDGCGVPTAKYDFFDLATGTFPQQKFYDLNKNYLTANPIIGIGTAFAPAISQNGNGSALVYGTASQNLQGKIGFQVAATSGIHVGPGVVGWQPLWLTQP